MECGKIIYASKGEALEASNGINKTKSLGSGNVYYCDECKGWHFTSGGIKSGQRRRRKYINKSDKEEVGYKNYVEKKTSRYDKVLIIRKYY